MPQYSYITFNNGVDLLAARLFNANKTQWVQAELEQTLIESLRTWNALSQFWRDSFSFNLNTNTWWYDLRTANNTLIPYTVTQDDVITNTKRRLLEPPSANNWNGSNQYAFSDLYAALQRRQDETLGMTACTIVRSVVTAVLQRRVTLPDTTIDIRRVTWLPGNTNNYSNTILRQTDAWAQRAYAHGYLQANNAAPTGWMQNTDPAPSFDVNRVPPIAGNYEVLVTQSGVSWGANNNNVLTMPDDWSWVFQFGALADLFSRESQGLDPLRAAYCRARYAEGLALMRMLPVALALNLNGVPVSLGAVTGADKYKPTWQALAAGAPKSAYTFMNLLAVAPKPANNNTVAQVTVCQNIPVATGNNNYIQVARDDLDTVIDYAQHLAMLKLGGAEFYQTINLYQNLQRRAALYNGKLREMGFFEMPQLDLATMDEQRNPRFQKGLEPQPIA